MGNPERPREPDQPYTEQDDITRLIAELIARGDWDASTPIPTGDLSTLPPELREYIERSLREQQQGGDLQQPPETP